MTAFYEVRMILLEEIRTSFLAGQVELLDDVRNLVSDSARSCEFNDILAKGRSYSPIAAGSCARLEATILSRWVAGIIN